jgi:PAS domain S-box-containing protein
MESAESATVKSPSILIVEDEIMLAKELARSLTSLGYTVAGRCCSAENCLSMVEESEPDLILMDVKLDGDLDGIEAAGQIRSRFDIPVVYLTGFAEKDALDRAKKTEPYGYLGKPVTLLELRSTIETALYRHEADKRVKESEERFRLLYENVPLPYQSLNEDGCFLEVNQTWLDVLGYSREEIIGKWFGDFLAPGYPDRFKVNFPKFKSAGEIHWVELDMVKKDGSTVSVAFDGQIGRDHWGHFKQTHCILHDITELKEAQKARQEAEVEINIRNRILEAFLAIPDDQLYAEILKIVLDVTESKYGTFGYFDEEGAFVVPSMTREIFWEQCQIAGKEIIFERGTFGGIWAKAIKEERTLFSNEGPFTTPEGHISINNTIATPIIYRGKVISAIHIANKRGNYDEADVRTLDTIAGTLAPVLNARLERDRQQAERKRADEALNKYSEELERRVQERTVELRQAELWTINIFESLDEAVFVVTPDRLMRNINSAAERIFGYTRDEVVGQSTELLHIDHEHYLDFGARIQESFKKGETAFFQFTAKRKNGEMFPSEHTVSLLRDSDGLSVGIVSIVRDITDRKMTEDALREAHEQLERRVVERTAELQTANADLKKEIAERKETEKKLLESEQRFKSIFDRHDAIMLLIEPDTGRIIEANQSAERFYGYARPDLLNMKIQQINMLSPDEVHEERQRAFSEKRNYFVFPHRLANGKVRTVEVHSSPIRYSGNQILFSIIHDITERKRAEEALCNSESRYRTILETSMEGFVLVDLNGRLLEVNDAYCKVTGYNREEILGMAVSQIEAAETPEETAAHLQTVLEKGSDRFESCHRRKDGSLMPVEVSAQFAPVDGGIFVAFVRDITDRKKSEEALRHSQQELTKLNERLERTQRAVDSASVAIFGIRKDGGFWYVNNAACQSLGRHRDELLRLSVHDVDTLFPLEARPDHWRRIRESGNVVLETVHQAKDGRRFLVEVTSNYFKLGDDELEWAFAQDITKRKKAEVALRTSEAQLSNALEMARLGHWEFDVLKNEFTFNDQFYKLFRTTADQVGGYRMALDEYARRFVHPDEIFLVSEESRKAIETDDPYFSRDLEHRIVYADGDIGHISVRYFIVKDEHNCTVKTYGVNQDITERKRAEEQIKASLAEKNVMLREIHHRVKNNLALINSLLSLRAEYPTGNTAREMFDEVRTRIRSMAVAHEILYQSENLAHISVPDYIGNLLNHLIYSHGSVGANIAVEKEIEEVDFGLSTAIPLGFLLTELVSNCLKHAFPNGRQGKVQVSLRSLAKNEFELVVADDGVGLPESVDFENPQSMGTDLIATFVEQLHGSIEIDRNDGTEVRIRFKEIGHKAER